MAKTLRRRKTKRGTRARVPFPRRTVTRREYAEIVVRLGGIELQAQRDRAVVELQTKRIAQLQEQVDALKNTLAAPSIAAEIPALPLPPLPTVES